MMLDQVLATPLARILTEGGDVATRDSLFRPEYGSDFRVWEPGKAWCSI
jgi:hypothetical protein